MLECIRTLFYRKSFIILVYIFLLFVSVENHIIHTEAVVYCVLVLTFHIITHYFDLCVWIQPSMV